MVELELVVGDHGNHKPCLNLPQLGYFLFSIYLSIFRARKTMWKFIFKQKYQITDRSICIEVEPAYWKKMIHPFFFNLFNLSKALHSLCCKFALFVVLLPKLSVGPFLRVYFNICDLLGENHFLSLRSCRYSSPAFDGICITLFLVFHQEPSFLFPVFWLEATHWIILALFYCKQINNLQLLVKCLGNARWPQENDVVI